MMRHSKANSVSEVILPWSGGLLSTRLWTCGSKVVVAVPELGLHCYGKSKAEAAFRLFSVLLKYYRQLKAFKSRLGERGLQHLDLLSIWVQSMESKMTNHTPNIAAMAGVRKR